MDSAWLALESPRNPLTITVLMRVEGLTWPVFRDFVATYWMAWERFRYRPLELPGGWCWDRNGAFDLDQHLTCLDEALTPAGLQAWVSARLNQPLTPERPRWHFWLLPNAEGGAAVLLRLHHCYADGLALLGIFDRICTRKPDELPQNYGCGERHSRRQWTQWLNVCLGVLQRGLSGGGRESGPIQEPPPDDEFSPRVISPAELWTMNGLRFINEVTGMVTEPEDSPSALKRSLLGRRHCRWSAPVALARFHRVAKRRGCSINDVLLSCVAAAMRGCMGLSGSRLNQSVVHAAVPVDIRRYLPRAMRPAGNRPGNFFGTVFVPMPVDAGFALERLYRIKHETRRLKRSWQPALAWGLSGLASVLPALLRQPIADLFFRKATAVVSNVPGTREPRYLAGCRVLEQMFWVPQAGEIGLGVSIVSYNGQVQFGVVADEAVLPDPDSFLRLCLDELGQLSDSL